MNYFAHGHQYLDDPFFVAGTAVPDWLNVANRKAKARAKLAQEWLDDDDPRVASLARGIMQHHYDDGWFHQTRAFVELSCQFAVELRDRLNQERGFRAGFLGHILVELLLDAILIEKLPGQLDRYYEVIDQLDSSWLALTINKMTTRPAPLLEPLIPRFCRERFLYDYLDDDRLLWRMNHVMRRVKLSPLPLELVSFLPTARQRVRDRQAELLRHDPAVD